MPLTDLNIDELREYRPVVAEPTDFDDFWDRTLAAARAAGPEAPFERVDGPLRSVDVYDVTFPGFEGSPIKGWLTCPKDRRSPLPVVVDFLGYGGGRGLPEEHLHWSSAGYVHLLMDSRGQGSLSGDYGGTAEPAGSVPAFPGVMTRGVLNPETYYYRRLFTDAVRAVDPVRILPFVDPSQVSVTGGSQGGGVSLAVAGLVPDLHAVMPDVSFACHYRRAVDIASEPPFTELTRFLAVHRDGEAQVFTTLSYFDCVNFAKRANAPALFSVALMDDIVPPSTVFAASTPNPRSPTSRSTLGAFLDPPLVEVSWRSVRSITGGVHGDRRFRGILFVTSCERACRRARVRRPWRGVSKRRPWRSMTP